MKHPKEEPAVPGAGEARPRNGVEEAGDDPAAVPPASESAGAADASDAAPAEAAEALRDRWLRTEAELQNFRRRARRDVDEATRFAEERMLIEIIELLDDLERAVDAAETAGAPESWLAGVKLVAGRMADVLGRHGVAPIDPAGAAFDPEQHEAMLEVDGGAVPPGHVTTVVRRGYRRNGRVLRAARVAVARAPAANED